MILIVDGNNLAAVMNAVGRLSTRDGFPTHAVSGFLRSLRMMCKEFQFEKIFVAWDGGRSAKRKELCPDYKASRDGEKTPQELVASEEFKMQVPVIKEMVEALGSHNVFGWGVEGDDLIALLVRAGTKQGKSAVIFSADKDFYQLIDENVSVYSTMSSKNRRITHQNIEAVHGVKANQWLEYKAIIGDDSDDIDGVKGVGEKTAKGLFVRYKCLDDFQKQALDGTPCTKREMKVLENLDLVRKNMTMMDLRNPHTDFKGVTVSGGCPNFPTLKALFFKYEFKEIYLDFPRWTSVFPQPKEMTI